MLGIIFFADEVFGATRSQIGYLIATWSFGYSVGCFLLRPVFGRLLPRHSMLVATVFMFLSTSILPHVKSLAWVFVLYGFLGLTASLFWPPMMGWLSVNIEGAELSRTMGRFNLCWSAGAIIGPVLAGRLSEIDPRLPIYFGCALCLVTSFLILGAIMTLSGLGHDDHAHAEERMVVNGNEGGTFLRFPAWLGVFTSYAVIGVIISVFPISGQRDLHISKSAVGILFFVRALISTIWLGIMGRTRFWHFRGKPMVISMLSFGLTMVWMAVARSVFLVGFLLALTGIFGAQNYANSLFHGVSGSTRRSLRMAVHESLLTAGLIFGSVSGGMIYQRYSTVMVYIFCSALLFASAAGQMILLAWRNTGSPGSPVPEHSDGGQVELRGH